MIINEICWKSLKRGVCRKGFGEKSRRKKGKATEYFGASVKRKMVSIFNSNSADSKAFQL